MGDNYGQLRVGVIGAGHIAGKVCPTLAQMEECKCTAVASRSLGKAQEFARQHGIAKVYGSYGELLDDPDIDIAYIATPHSHHHDVAMEAIRKGKPCLVEKSFMANAREAGEVLDLAAERNVFVAEAIWTRYMPSARMLRELIDRGAVGEVAMISAGLCFPVDWKPRLMRPELGGGALLDLGVYTINFMLMCHRGEIDRVVSNCILSPSGVDLQDSMSFTFRDGVMADLHCSARCATDKRGVVSGTDGYIVVDNINNPCSIKVFSKSGELTQELDCRAPISGFEYEFLACRKAIAEGRIEPEEMPHSEILRVMSIMDGLRKEWGVRFPLD